MRIRVDLHIHSCLSPCADDSMTPWNIVGMAKLKGLDAVAICDHNGTLNIKAAIKAGNEYGVCVVPGIEVTSREDIHLLCYFPTLEAAEKMGEAVEKCQLKIKNKPSVFGNQIIVDEDDEPCGEVERLLLSACDMDINDVADKARTLGGIMVPAHINKGANSLLPTLGLMPQTPEMPTVEVFKMRPHSALGKLCIMSSDAHMLEDILEQGFELECDELSAQGIVNALLRGETERSIL
ncbi:MAG: PHP domain-containing protein [Clostridia bacterium]|nr:PHP domain-containing protein [Clostridia bacterium]